MLDIRLLMEPTVLVALITATAAIVVSWRGRISKGRVEALERTVETLTEKHLDCERRNRELADSLRAADTHRNQLFSQNVELLRIATQNVVR